MTQNIHFITDMNKLSELRYKKKPIVLQFYTEWCPPCKKIRQILQKQVKSNGNFILACINCDQAEQLNIQYEIEGVPTVISLSNDQKLAPLDKVIGYDAKKVKQFFDKMYKDWADKKN